MRQFSIALGILFLAAANAAAGISYSLNSTMTIPYPATASGNAVDLTVHYTDTTYTAGTRALTATGSPFTESSSTALSQTFSSPGPGIDILPGQAETLSWSVLSGFTPFGGSFDQTVDTGWNTEWVGSYDWTGVSGTFVPMSFATVSSSGTTQLQFVNQMPSTDITYSELSIFNNGSPLIVPTSGSILGGTSSNIGAPFAMASDFALHVKDDFTGVRYDLTWGVAAPEPSGLLLVAPAMAVLWWRRKRKSA